MDAEPGGMAKRGPGKNHGHPGDLGNPGEPSDRGDMVMGWLVRIALILAVVGVIGFDLVTTVQSQVTATDQANAAAAAGYTTYSQTHSVQAAYQAALVTARDANPADVIRPSDFVVTPAGVVTLKLTRPVHTLIAHYLPIPAAKLATATGSAQSTS
jgi:hypothetical protein